MNQTYSTKNQSPLQKFKAFCKNSELSYTNSKHCWTKIKKRINKSKILLHLKKGNKKAPKLPQPQTHFHVPLSFGEGRGEVNLNHKILTHPKKFTDEG